MDIKQYSPELEIEFKAFVAENLANSLHHHFTIRGVLFAISASPEIPMPDQWLHWVFKNAPDNLSEQTVNDLIGYLLSLFQHQSKLTNEESFNLLPECEFNESVEQSQNLCHWCYGWLIGHMQMENTWTKAYDELEKKDPATAVDIEQMLAKVLSSITPFAEYLDSETINEQYNYSQLASHIPDLASKYVSCANNLVDYLPNQFENFHQPIRRAGEKVGRNQPCICGSGKKYKKCCGQ